MARMKWRQTEKNVTFLVHFKAEQFIIKNKNIKQERKKLIRLTNLFLLQFDHLASSTERMTY